eukprot:1089972-Rhodomonas_salina.1
MSVSEISYRCDQDSSGNIFFFNRDSGTIPLCYPTCSCAMSGTHAENAATRYEHLRAPNGRVVQGLLRENQGQRPMSRTGNQQVGAGCKRGLIARQNTTALARFELHMLSGGTSCDDDHATATGTRSLSVSIRLGVVYYCLYRDEDGAPVVSWPGGRQCQCPSQFEHTDSAVGP